MSYNNLRIGRASSSHHFYFVTIVTHQRVHWFTDLFTARILVNCMFEIHQDKYINSLSWVIMPDHLHWLFQLGNKTNLSDAVKRLKGKSSKLINEHLARKGRFWQPGYYDHGIRNDENVRQIARYIVANPLRAGLVECLEEYPHWDAVWL